MLSSVLAPGKQAYGPWMLSCAVGITVEGAPGQNGQSDSVPEFGHFG